MEKSRAIELLEYLRQDRNLEGTIYGDALNMAIEALKAQLSKEGTTKDATSDLIRKTETVGHLRRMLEATVPNTDYDEGFVDGVQFAISTVSTMPTIQPEPQWIPVSERLPEEYGEYLVTKRIIGWNCEEYDVNDIAYFDDDGFPKSDRVIAWMPLPEPYKPNNK